MHTQTATINQFEEKRIEIIEDVGRRQRKAEERAERLRKSQFELMNQATRAADMSQVDTSIKLRQQAQDALAEFRKITHIEIPALQTEVEQIQNGTHSALAALGGSMAARSRLKLREEFEAEQALFAKLLTPELKKSAIRLVELAHAHLETPAAVAVAIANA